MTIPTGYTLANQKTLSEVITPTETSPTGQQLEQAVNLWKQGHSVEAVQAFLAVDWTAPMQFSKEAYLFYMTEEQVVTLTQEDRQQVMQEILPELSKIRGLSKEVIRLGQEAQAAGDPEVAELYFTTSLALGRQLDPSPDRMLIVRLMGIGIKKLSLTELARLYEQTDQSEKATQVQTQLEEINREHQVIKDIARGL
jgi:hypothetical protein